MRAKYEKKTHFVTAIPQSSNEASATFPKTTNLLHIISHTHTTLVFVHPSNPSYLHITCVGIVQAWHGRAALRPTDRPRDFVAPDRVIRFSKLTRSPALFLLFSPHTQVMSMAIGYLLCISLLSYRNRIFPFYYYYAWYPPCRPSRTSQEGINPTGCQTKKR